MPISDSSRARGEPWVRRPDWATGRIESSHRLVSRWIFALGWNLPLALVLFAIWRGLTDGGRKPLLAAIREQPPLLALSLFIIVGVVLLYRAVGDTVRVLISGIRIPVHMRIPSSCRVLPDKGGPPPAADGRRRGSWPDAARYYPRRLLVGPQKISLYCGPPLVGARRRLATAEAEGVVADPKNFRISRKGRTDPFTGTFLVGPPTLTHAEARWLAAEIERALAAYR